MAGILVRLGEVVGHLGEVVPGDVERIRKIEEGIDYYRLVAQAEGLNVRLYEEVTDIQGTDGAFTVATNKGSYVTRKVVAVTGFFDFPNPLNIPGDDLLMVTHYFTEP